ncbi:monosaccharide ABC transporter membrane protein (CUT2 family) [Homoserinimonas aerilata]|uniref:Monosaccharide ABC transporter membrane protein (CUT2 family) n=1 Tax=Homoserinimonas aerilata TaxID=1162970 RepID=A0A542YL31_9MICO|nr:ABC transporter permease [Homoserinimonas aerilata]TQL48771.1 monosaccharide ABC transporter membrane protein (CUT2 family) [Homoserinimonas aerilata]
MTTSTRAWGFSSLMRNYGIAVFLVLMVVVFSALMPGTFASAGNFRQILADQAVPGILALAVILPLAAGEFDLSVGANLGICTILGIVLAASGAPIIVVIAATILVGAAIGAINAFMTIVVGVNAFIATLAMATILAGLNLLLTNSTLIIHGSDEFSALTNTRIEGIQLVIVYFAVIAVVLWYLLERTPFGRYLRATGMGRDAATLSGVRTKRYLAAAFIGAGVLAGIAGTLQASRAGNATPDLGPEFLLPAYAAAFLGATAIRAGYFNVWGTVIGVYLLAVGANGLIILGAKTWVTHVFNGVALLVAVSAATLVQRNRAAARKAAQPPQSSTQDARADSENKATTTRSTP